MFHALLILIFPVSHTSTHACGVGHKAGIRIYNHQVQTSCKYKLYVKYTPVRPGKSGEFLHIFHTAAWRSPHHIIIIFLWKFFRLNAVHNARADFVSLCYRQQRSLSQHTKGAGRLSTNMKNCKKRQTRKWQQNTGN
jgi:hypothetical protein